VLDSSSLCLDLCKIVAAYTNDIVPSPQYVPPLRARTNDHRDRQHQVFDPIYEKILGFTSTLIPNLPPPWDICPKVDFCESYWSLLRRYYLTDTLLMDLTEVFAAVDKPLSPEAFRNSILYVPSPSFSCYGLVLAHSASEEDIYVICNTWEDALLRLQDHRNNVNVPDYRHSKAWGFISQLHVENWLYAMAKVEDALLDLYTLRISKCLRNTDLSHLPVELRGIVTEYATVERAVDEILEFTLTLFPSLPSYIELFSGHVSHDYYLPKLMKLLTEDLSYWPKLAAVFRVVDEALSSSSASFARQNIHVTH
jgi:hypothetical protein